MTEDDDQIATWSQQLPAIDVDAPSPSASSSARAARSSAARHRKRFVLPAIATLVTAAYLGWTIDKLIETSGTESTCSTSHVQPFDIARGARDGVN